MHKWWKQFKLENRFIYRNWFLLATPLVFALLMVYGLSGRGHAEVINPTGQFLQKFYDLQPLIHTMTLGIVMFLGVVSVRHHYNQRAYELYGAWPVSQSTIISTKFIASLLYFSIYTALMVIVFWLQAQHFDPSTNVIDNQLTYNVLKYEWSYSVTLALGMFLAIFIPGRTAYLIAFCGWMFGTYFLDIFIIGRYELFFLKPFHLNKYFMYTGNLIVDDTTWGLSLIEYETWLSRLFVIAFGVLLFAGMIWLIKNKRPTQSLLKWHIIVAAILLLTAASAVPYGALWADRYTTYAAHRADSVPYAADHPHSNEAKEIKRMGNNIPESDTYRFPVSSYNIKAEQTGRNTLAVHTRITVPAKATGQHQPLTFTLNRGFTVKKLTMNGKSVDFTRKGDHIQITGSADKPEGPRTFKFQYKGHITEWAYGYGKERTYAFIRGSNVFLPSYIAWYPLPGKQPLYYHYNLLAGPKFRVNQENGLTDSGADFSVTLNDFHNRVYTTVQQTKRTDDTQTFTGKKTDGVTLIAGNLSKASAQDQDVALIGPTPYKQELEQFTPTFADRADYYRGWLDLPDNMNNVFFLPTSYITGNLQGISIQSSYITRTDRISFLYLDKEEGNIQDQNIMNTLQTALLHESSAYYGGPGGLTMTIRELINHMYGFEKKDKDIEVVHMEGDHDSKKVIQMVKNALKEGKLAEVKQVLKHFYEQGLSVDKSNISLQDWQQVWDRVMKQGGSQ